MLYAYQITGDISYRCEVCDTQAQADAFAASGGTWYVSDTTVNWSLKKYVSGSIQDRNVPTQVLCYYNNGLSFRTVDSTYIAQAGEVLFLVTPTTDQLTAAFPNYSYTVKHQAKLAIDDQYNNYYLNLDRAYAGAVQLGNPTSAIAAKRAELLAAHKAAKEAIDNG